MGAKKYEADFKIKTMSETSTQVAILEKDATALLMLRDALQYQRMIYNLTNLLEQRSLAIKAKQACGNDKWKEDYNAYIEQVNSDIKKLLAI